MNARTITAVLLAYVFPGAGHFYLGRRKLAYAYCAILVLLFALGIAVGGRLYKLGENRDSILHTLSSFGSMGSGALYFVASSIKRFGGDVTSGTFEYGRMFTLSTGLMNLLLVLDCYDIARGRKE